MKEDVAVVENKNGNIILNNEQLSCAFNETNGNLICISANDMILDNCGFSVDIGCDDKFIWHTLKFQGLDDLHTWETPTIIPENDFMDMSNNFVGFERSSSALVSNYLFDELAVAVIYSVQDSFLKIEIRISNESDQKRIINGIAFEASSSISNDASFEFPGNVPYNIFKAGELPVRKVIQSGQIAPFVHTCSNGKHYNVIFLDPEEKWSTGVFKPEDGKLKYVNLAAVESYLLPGQTLYCGDMFIQLVGDGNPYLAVRNFYALNGWVPPTNGIADGVMYSCHPTGTMDAGFPLKRDLFQYADDMKAVKEMGIDHIWLLPIFEHNENGVYHPGDMSIIDKRYGGEKGAKYFSDKVHELGMGVLYDFVPHGPNVNDEFAKQHMYWAAVDREGSYKEEWDCLSFDMANPEYQQYITDMVRSHIERFDIDGSRIDCAMGGLSNWKPCPGNRPSSSNLKGGVGITGAIREAFIKEGKKSLILPENFNPIPFYYPYTDVFYDMPLYRVLMDLDEAKLTDEEYVAQLTRWLEREMMSTPEGLCKLRFLGNHDTVSWTWQAKRAVNTYGAERAKALWTVMAFIDGMPMIYQGDEDPSMYGGQGPELRQFFKDLYDARKEWLGNQYDIKYIKTNTSIMAFKREEETNKRLVLINLSPKAASCDLDLTDDSKVVYGSCDIDGQRVSLGSYDSAIITWKG